MVNGEPDPASVTPPEPGDTQVWTPQVIERFWRYQSRSAEEAGICFSHQFDRGLRSFLTASGALRSGARVLDYGCGPGHLLEQMLRAGATCRGIDLSARAVAAANRRLGRYRRWQGASLPEEAEAQLPANSFDLITCIETIEHLHGEELDRLLHRLGRWLAAGGFLFVTTPNEEDIRSSMIFCPFCQTRFHPMQHLQSFWTGSLTTSLQSRGYEVVLCTATNLAWFQYPRSPLEWSLRHLGSLVLRRWRRLTDRIGRRSFAGSQEHRRWLGHGPHLVALARRPAAAAASSAESAPPPERS